MNAIRNQFLKLVSEQFPNLNTAQLAELTSEQLFSPFTIELPQSALTQAKDFIAAAFSLRKNADYLAQHEQKLKVLGLKDPGNFAICMSYDFHWDGSSLKLIEINTNAAFLVMSHWLYRAHGISDPLASKIPDDLRESILQEIESHRTHLSVGATQKLLPISPRVAVIDEAPEQQRLFIEFLLFQELARSWGWTAEILEASSIQPGNFDFIYNRTTDFYFNSGKLQNLRKAYFENQTCFSPHPLEYYLLADKQRMIDWSKASFSADSESLKTLQNQMRPHLPKNIELTPENAAEIWAERKKFFIKPMRSFGSKQSYRGASISRNVFDEIANQGFIAQEFIPAPEIDFSTDQGPVKLKYDLRFYAYQDQLQGVIARLYQGQTTNLRTLHGGFAPVVFL